MTTADTIEDVLIIGAGLSGIGMACTLARTLPGKSWRIIEARPRLGGTWDLFRYPGIRSDSDLYTFSYEFKPWTSENAIASAAEITDYLREAAQEHGVLERITYDTRVTGADWDSTTALWTVHTQGPEGAGTLRCRWLFGATGYYDYDQGHRPTFPGEAAFQGSIIHAQHWPEGLDVAGKRVAVIGSGATAVTLVPALARTAAHVTQVQRTPTYVVPLPQKDGFARFLSRIASPERTHRIMRWRNSRLQWLFYQLYQRFPKFGRWHIRHEAAKHLPKDFPYDVHFNPPYGPWDQRLCVVPDGDLFSALSDGSASMATGQIAEITADGIRMEDGTQVPADIIVLATGLQIKLLGGVDIRVDGAQINPAERLVFKSMMLDGIPNFAFAVGYTNSSWTLKVSLTFEHQCRLLQEMDRQGAEIARVQRPATPMAERPLMDFGAGYIQRSLDRMPKQGDRMPWVLSSSYLTDLKMTRRGQVTDPALTFSRRQTTGA